MRATDPARDAIRLLDCLQISQKRGTNFSGRLPSNLRIVGIINASLHHLKISMIARKLILNYVTGRKLSNGCIEHRGLNNDWNLKTEALKVLQVENTTYQHVADARLSVGTIVQPKARRGVRCKRLAFPPLR